MGKFEGDGSRERVKHPCKVWGKPSRQWIGSAVPSRDTNNLSALFCCRWKLAACRCTRTRTPLLRPNPNHHPAACHAALPGLQPVRHPLGACGRTSNVTLTGVCLLVSSTRQNASQLPQAATHPRARNSPPQSQTNIFVQPASVPRSRHLIWRNVTHACWRKSHSATVLSESGFHLRHVPSMVEISDIGFLIWALLVQIRSSTGSYMIHFNRSCYRKTVFPNIVSFGIAHAMAIHMRSSPPPCKRSPPSRTHLQLQPRRVSLQHAEHGLPGLSA